MTPFARPAVESPKSTFSAMDKANGNAMASQISKTGRVVALLIQRAPTETRATQHVLSSRLRLQIRDLHPSLLSSFQSDPSISSPQVTSTNNPLLTDNTATHNDCELDYKLQHTNQHRKFPQSFLTTRWRPTGLLTAPRRANTSTRWQRRSSPRSGARIPAVLIETAAAAAAEETQRGLATQTISQSIMGRKSLLALVVQRRPVSTAQLTTKLIRQRRTTKRG